jgi:hypothetical protein
VPDACSIRGLIGKPDLIGMVMHMGRRRDVGSMGVNGWVCMSCPHQLRASLVAETGALSDSGPAGPEPEKEERTP